MRITNNMLVSNMTYNLNGTMKRLERLQYENSVGKKFRVPSDDPIGASKSLKFNTDISKVQQYSRNVKDAESWMKETEGALKEINEILHRANELTVQAANDTNGADLDKIAQEIKELKGHLIQVGNSNYAGRSLFTGFKTNKNLLDDKGKYVVNLKKYELTNEKGNKILDSKGNPVLKDEIFVYNVGVAETVEVNTLGNSVFGSGDKKYKEDVNAGDKAYLIKIFDDLEGSLGVGNKDGIQKALTDIKDSRDNILSITSEIGAKSNRLELTKNKLDEQLVNLKELLSFNEDVSLPEAFMNLNIAENTYRSSLATGARIIQPSLMDFLR